MDFARQARQSILEFTWSLWAELGIPGWTRVHQDWWIDPEALLVFTPHVHDLDARLREEVIKWTARHQRFLSAGRLKSLLRGSHRLDLGESMPSVIALVTRAPGSLHVAEPREGRGNLDFARPAQLSFRLRALFGVGARAEVLRAFLLMENDGITASHMAAGIMGYTKRAVQVALEDLHLARVCTIRKRGNASIYWLEQRSPIAALASWRALRAPRWIPLFECLVGILQISRMSEGKPGITEVLSLRGAARGLDGSVEAADLPRLPHEVRGSAFVEAFRTWTLDLLSSLASGSLPRQ